MINQDLQAAMPAAGVAIAELQEFIDDRPDAREVRKALAVKLVYQGYKGSNAILLDQTLILS